MRPAGVQDKREDDGNPMKSQLFILDMNMLDAMEPEEVEATWDDMVELGINKAPYDSFTIQLPYGPAFAKMIFHQEPTNLDMKGALSVPLRLSYQITGETVETAHVKCGFYLQGKNGTFFNYIDNIMSKPDVDQQAADILTKTASRAASWYLTYLIVALATKNVVRHVTHNRLAKFGRGKQDYEYVTTLKMGVLIEDDSLPHPSGEVRRPHLRRGHVRNQRYGPSFSYSRKVFIAPIFVNGYVEGAHDDRRAYNVSPFRKRRAP